MLLPDAAQRERHMLTSLRLNKIMDGGRAVELFCITQRRVPVISYTKLHFLHWIWWIKCAFSIIRKKNNVNIKWTLIVKPSIHSQNLFLTFDLLYIWYLLSHLAPWMLTWLHWLSEVTAVLVVKTDRQRDDKMREWEAERTAGHITEESLLLSPIQPAVWTCCFTTKKAPISSDIPYDPPPPGHLFAALSWL